MDMSQSPSPNNGGSASPVPIKRRKKAASPFIKRDHFRRQFLKNKMKNGGIGSNGVKKEEDPDAKAQKLLQPKMEQYVKDEYDAIKKNERKDSLLHSTEEDEYDEFPLRAVDAAAIFGIKNNIMKFQSKKPMVPEESLHLPVRLHRKDTRNLQFQLTRAEIVQRQKEIAEYKQTMVEKENSKGKNGKGKNGEEESFTTASGGSITISKADPKSSSSEKNTSSDNKNLQKGEGELRPQEAGKVLYDGQETFEGELAEGTMDPFADVAPDGGARAKRGWAGKRKTRKLRLLDENAKKLRFEEYYPWVLEDFDGFNTWVGSYEAGNSDQYVMFSVQKDGSFTMLPADKVYRFTARSQYATLTIDEAEKRFEKNKNVVPRWLMKHLDDIGTTTTRFDRTMRKLKAVDGMKKDDNDDDGMEGLFGKRDNSDNELDYDEEFQDDEEAPIIDGNEEENKESEQRLKKEMLQANAMGLRDEDVNMGVEEEDEEVDIDEEGKEVKKALRKTDLGALYDSDEEKNPYLSDSDIEEKEKEKEKEKEQKSSSSSSSAQTNDSPSKNSAASNKSKSPAKQRGAPKKIKKIKTTCKKYKNGLIIIKTDPSILKNFPPGEWNPQLAGASSETPSSSTEPASIKTEETDSFEDKILTEQDIIDIVSEKKITLKELIKELKKKVSMNPENRERMKAYVRKLVKLTDGYLELTN